MKALRINKQMLVAKLAIFFVNAKDGMYRPFLTVYLTSVGLSPGQAGLISAAAMCGGASGGIVLSILADRLNLHTLIMIITNIASMSLTASQPWIATALQPSYSNCSLPYMAAAKSSTWSNKHQTQSSQLQRNETLGPEISNVMCDHASFRTLFYVSLFVFAVMRFFDGPNTGFCFSTVAASVREQTDGSSLGRQLLFGGIGIASTAALGGVFVDTLRVPGLSIYSVVFLMYPITILLYLSSTLKLHCGLKERQRRHQESTVWQSFKVVLVNGPLIFFFMTVFVTGLGLNLVYGYLTLRLEELNASGTIMGLCTFSSALSSVLGMEVASTMIKKFGGPLNAIGIACFSYCVRLAGFSIMTKPWQAPIIQILHFFGYGLFLPSVIQHIDNVSPVNIKMSMQTIAFAVHFQFSGIVADTSGGKIYEMFGGKLLYGSGAILLGVWSVVVLCYALYRAKARKGYYTLPGESTIENNDRQSPDDTIAVHCPDSETK